MKTIFSLFVIFFVVSCVSNDENSDLLTISTPPPEVASSTEVTSVTDIHLSSLSFAGATSTEKVSPTQVRVGWSVLEGAAGYQVFKVDESTGTAVLDYIGTAAATDASYLVEGLTAETTYKFRVRSLDAEGKIDSNEINAEVTTDAYDEWANGQSLSFSGAEYVSIGQSKTLLNESAFTVSLWFKTTTSGATQNGNYLISSFYNYNETFSFGIGFSRTAILAKMRNSSNTVETISKTTSYANGSWHNVVATYDGTTLTLYLDGTSVGSSAISFLGFGVKPVIIGARSSTSYFYRGQIDEVSIWPVALSSTEVAELMNGTAAADINRHSRFTEMSHWYRFESADDTATINDQVSDGTNGTPTSIAEEDFTADAP